jgi:hypothetical protein
MVCRDARISAGMPPHSELVRFKKEVMNLKAAEQCPQFIRVERQSSSVKGFQTATGAGYQGGGLMIPRTELAASQASFTSHSVDAFHQGESETLARGTT